MGNGKWLDYKYRNVECPKEMNGCGASPGQKCRKVRGRDGPGRPPNVDHHHKARVKQFYGVPDQDIELRGREVGSVDWLDNVFRTTRDSGRHFCYKHKGYGIQKGLLRRLENMGVGRILMTIFDSGRWVRFSVPVRAWLEEGIHDTLNPDDGEQVFLPSKRMQELNDGGQS